MQFRREKRTLNGVLLLDKPQGLSSNTALQIARRHYRAAKAGHTGTLDPMATGLLPICFGEATKFSRFLLDADKTYEASLQLGITTTTGDAEGEILERKSFLEIATVPLSAICAQFVGVIEQVPPMYSALKHEGRALYEYARKGQIIEREPRRVTIHRLDVLGYESGILRIAVECSKGTYIRTLAEDIGQALGCGAHLTALRRTATASFHVSEAYSLEVIEAFDERARDAKLLSVDVLVKNYPPVRLSGTQAEAFAHGQTIDSVGEDGLVRVYDERGFRGMAERRMDRLQPERLCVYE